MTFSEINTEKKLWDFMTDPSDALVKSLRQQEGDMIVLGGSGKMGKELVALLKIADRINGLRRKITVVSTFSNPEDQGILEGLEVNCLKGDLSDEIFLKQLPDAPLVMYMMGFKFGSAGDWRKAFHLNSVVPYLIGNKYPESNILVFSSGNPYPHTGKNSPGCKEEDQLDPRGIYGWSIVARESSFSTTAMQFPDQKIGFFRLMYAQHLYYGVLIDLAQMIMKQEPISLQMPSVNLISQRDANEIALRALAYCQNPPYVLNVAGAAWPVRTIAEKMGQILKVPPVFLEDEAETALLADDQRCISVFGDYRDDPEDMILAAASWILEGGTTWDKPTYFGRANHRY
jgi:nucleoside-diphosphate-sugar epimerase